MTNPFPPLPIGDAPLVFVQTAQGKQPPVSAAKLKELLTSGALGPDAGVWYEGLPGWVRAGDLPDLRGLGKINNADDQMDAVFGGLVKDSWTYFKEHERAGYLDEVMVGAIITTALDSGYSLIDLGSDGTHHYLRLEALQGDQSRLVFQLAHLTPGLVAAKVLGQRMSVVVGYGERLGNFSQIWQALKAEFKSGYVQNPEPGTITVDGDVSSGYVYVQIDLYLDVKNYVGDDDSINYPRIHRDIGATINALRKYLRGRFGR